MTKPITLEKALELVDFVEISGKYCVSHVKGNVEGHVEGTVYGSVEGHVHGGVKGTIGGGVEASIDTCQTS